MPDMSVNLIEPDDKEFESIKKLVSSLDIAPDENELIIVDQAHNVRIELPHALYRVLVDAAHQLAKGNTVGVLHYEQDITTQQAADLLQVSRPHVVKILEAGDIPYHMVGSHRRIRLSDLLEYKKNRDAMRREKLNDLIRISESSGLYELNDFPEED
ncbi:helix-turn-helix domain-containing protein [Alicyclobacillus fodiniaquatilis]|jgi:excisionase family DNA binding protein|uniref:Helix-turn-helix domain-containing protein n=1 Tax=Alicyclobacillus fodiniaquatilis TaxID=1661150 RepID=A0ABW4JDV6_9BACL